MSQLQTTDFTTGKYKIAQDNYSTASLRAYIEKYEKIYLQELLGVDLYDLYIAAVNGNGGVNPAAGIYLDIHAPFSEDNNTANYFINEIARYQFGKIIRSEGILEMLKGFIYFEFVRDQPVKNTISGNAQEEGETSKILNSVMGGIREKYNAAVATTIAIQWRCIDRSSIYPLYNGEVKEVITY